VTDESTERLTNGIKFGGHNLQVIGDAALYWPAYKMLLVADLHLEKGSSYAQSGQMLPPYDSLKSLEDIAALAGKCGAISLACLGDNFHDDKGELRLAGQAAILLRELTARYDWHWITGNHDPALEGRWGGTAHSEIELGGIMLRHEAQRGFVGAEISGHFHPKLRVNLNQRHVARRCFVITDRKIILPAFGAYTGGMDAADAAMMAQPEAITSGTAAALVALPGRLLRFSLPYK
jgi:uncharacterized protein